MSLAVSLIAKTRITLLPVRSLTAQLFDYLAHTIDAPEFLNNPSPTLSYIKKMTGSIIGTITQYRHNA